MDPEELLERFFGFTKGIFGSIMPWAGVVVVLFLLGQVLRFDIGLRRAG